MNLDLPLIWAGLIAFAAAAQLAYWIPRAHLRRAPT